MAKLIGNYKMAGQPDAVTAAPGSETKEETAVVEFERRALERLGGSIAFVMKGKNVVWTGTAPIKDPKKP
jgi:hypothetical protein